MANAMSTDGHVRNLSLSIGPRHQAHDHDHREGGGDALRRVAVSRARVSRVGSGRRLRLASSVGRRLRLDYFSRVVGDGGWALALHGRREWAWMSRLVQAEFPAARQDDRRQQTERLVTHRMGQLDALGLELFDGRVHIVAGEIELVVTGALGRMGSELAGGSPKISQPSPASTDGNPSTSLKSFRTPCASLL